MIVVVVAAVVVVILSVGIHVVQVHWYGLVVTVIISLLWLPRAKPLIIIVVPFQDSRFSQPKHGCVVADGKLPSFLQTFRCLIANLHFCCRFQSIDKISYLVEVSHSFNLSYK